MTTLMMLKSPKNKYNDKDTQFSVNKNSADSKLLSDNNETNCCAKRIRQIFFITISLLVNCLLVLGIVLYKLHEDGTYLNGNIVNLDNLQSGLYLRCGNSSDYCNASPFKSFENLQIIISTEYRIRQNIISHVQDKEESRPILTQRFSNMYFVDKTNITDYQVTLHSAMPYRRKSRIKSVTVPFRALYLVFVSVEYRFINGHESSESTLDILWQSGDKTSVIFKATANVLKIILNNQAFDTTCHLLPVILNQNDSLSVRITHSSNIYDMRVGNVFGLQEIQKVPEEI